MLRSLLPPMHGLRVLDLGCGFGWFSRWAAAEGARTVVGIDLSANMLARACLLADARIIYLSAAGADAAGALELEAGRHDLAFSSLTLHYIEELPALVRQVHRALAPGRHFVFSVEHPILLAPTAPKWTILESGATVWPLDRYLDEGPRSIDWLVNGVAKVHRTVATYLNVLMESGFSIRRIEEWGPSPKQISRNPDWALERHRPYFLQESQ